jgi:hypothetical protein
MPKRGISILDLIGLPPGSAMFIPNAIASQLEKLTVLDYSATTAGDVHIHRGSVMSVADAWLPGLRNLPLQAPMLNTGLPFQLIRRRTPLGPGQNIEPAAQGWQIDLFLDRVAFTVPGLRPARRVESLGTTARHLVPDPSRKDVRIVGGGTLRIAANGGAPVVAFVSPSDPIDPDAPAGALFELGFDPPHFFLGGSEVGLTVDRLAYDGSSDFTPAEIAARGHGGDWQGIAIREATVYMPRNAPLIGDLSTSVRDLLLGQPAGLQGELQVEFGVSKISPQAVQFQQGQVNGGEIGLPQALDKNGQALVTYSKLDGVDFGLLKANAADAATNFQFTLPDGSVVRGTSSGWFEARGGNTLGVQSIEPGDDGQEALSTLYPFFFTEGIDAHVPTIGVSFPDQPIDLDIADQQALADVIYVSGRREQLQGIAFTASAVPGADPALLQWQFGSGLGADTGSGPVFKPAIPPTLGKIDLLLRDAAQRPRRLRMEVLTEGPLVFGAASGAWTLNEQRHAQRVKLRGIEASNDAAEFAPNGMLFPAYTDAEVAPLGDGIVSTMGTGGTVLEVTLDMGHPDAGPYADPPDAPAPSVRRHLQLVMEFASTDPTGWGLDGLAKPFSIAALQEWATQFGDAAHFVVIGRTCDIGGDESNAVLATLRANAVVDMLAPVVGMLSQIHARGEFEAAIGDAVQNEAAVTPPMSSAEKTPGNLIKSEHPELYDNDRFRAPRQLYRRVDIYAVGGSDAEAAEKLADEQTRVGPALRRALLPGGDVVIPVMPPAPGTTRTFRVRLTVKWDSPTVDTLADAIPTLAEVLVTWDKPASLALPGPDIPAGMDQAALAGPNVFTLIGRWTYDSRGGATQFSLAFNNDGSAGGLFSANNKVLATALLLAPALLSGVTANSPTGAGARLATLLAASVAAVKYVNAGKITVHGIEVQEQQRALGQFADATHRILFDYTAEISLLVNEGAIQISTSNPLKVRYENCGIEFDGSKTGLAAVNLVYDEARFDVADPGQWTIDGGLGKLLRVAGTRAGSGSTWFEIDLEFALDLGPVKVTGTTVRITFPTSAGGKAAVEVRGLGVEVNIPKVLEGKGRLTLGAGGAFKSDIVVKVIPANVEARASLVLGPSLKYLEVGVLLPMGIPLGASGVGIFGFIGRFVVNGRRTVKPDGDPVANEIAWYRALGSDKYTGEQAAGQYALGLGAVLGTLPDTGFTFNATGMFTVAFPDPEVVISLDAKLASQPSLQASETGSASPGNSLEVLGIIVANEHEFILGLRGRYQIPKVLDLKIPVSGYFPIGDANKAYYFRVGSDGVNGRDGSAVTATLLPGSLDFNCWLFLMVEEKQLLNLGDAPKWGGKQIDLHGYALGFGAGFDIDWSADPFSLHAGAIFILGLGTKPLTVVGMIAAEGELDLVIVSATVQARVQGQIQRIAEKTTYWLDGEFKAEVDLGLCTVSGSIHFHVDEGGKATPPEPEHPLVRVDLVDRRGTVTGRAGAAGCTVWPDTTPVLHFAHKVVNALQGSGSAFAPGAGLPGPEWTGATELQYAFRLKKLVLRKKGGAALAGPLDSVWWWPTHKGGLISPDDPLPSSHEARALALLSWNPGLASCSLIDGGKGGPGDPANTLDDVCDPPVAAGRNLVLGSTASGQGLGQVKMVPAAPGQGPLPTWFELLGTSSGMGKDYAGLILLMNAQGRTVMPGAVVNFASALAVAGESQAIAAAWELPRIELQQFFERTLQFDAQIVGPINAPALTLAVWNQGDRQPVGSTLCDRYTDLRSGARVTSGTLRNGWRYDSLAVPPQAVQAVDKYPQGAPDGKIELSAVGGFSVDFGAPVHSVSVDLVQWGAVVTVRAYAANGGLVAQANSQMLPNTPQTLTLSVPAGLQRISLALANSITGGDFVVREICSTTLRDPLPPTLPIVTGVASGNAAQQAWPAQSLGNLPGPGGGSLQLLRYVPNAALAWKSLRIAPYDGGHLLLLGLSGVDAAMQALSQQNEVAKAEIQDQLNQNGNPNAPVSAKHLLLEPGVSYEVEVELEWAGWLKSKAQPSPPSIAELAQQGLWKPFTKALPVFDFKVAAASVPNDMPPPADFQDESQFDPRALQRYLLGLVPDGGLPHFLDDEICAKFAVDYADRLVDLYGRSLALKLRRTDPPCGTLANGDNQFLTPADLISQISASDLQVGELPKAEQWLAEPQGLAPCITGKGPKGKKLVVQAPIEPDAEYDLMLVAPPKAQPQSDQVLVARAHFHTSRYANPQAMLSALGLRAAPNPLRPHDLILAQAFGVQVVDDKKLLQRDRELEQMLRTLGLDPLPVPRRPRLTLLWAPSGQSHLLCGAVVDSDEPTDRGARMAPGPMQLLRPNQADLNFGLLRSSASGTRLLYWLNTAVAPPPKSVLKLGFKDRNSTVWGSRVAPTTPRAVYEENAS